MHPLYPTGVINLHAPCDRYDESRIIDALAVAYLNGRQEIDLREIATPKLLAVTHQLSNPNAAGYLLRNSFSLAVFFQSQRRFALSAMPDGRDRIRFTPERRRFVSPKPPLPPSASFTCEISPLFNFS